MRILALDPGARTGFACGEVGEIPSSGAIRLVEKGAGPFDAPIALSGWLTQRLEDDPVDLVAREMPFNPRFAKSMRAGYALVQLGDVIEQVCRRFRLPCHQVYPSSARKAFCGVGAGPRVQMKRMVILQCKYHGWIAQDDYDDDRADALCLWAYMEQQCSTLWGETIKCASKAKAKKHTAAKSSILKPRLTATRGSRAP